MVTRINKDDFIRVAHAAKMMAVISKQQGEDEDERMWMDVVKKFKKVKVGDRVVVEVSIYRG